MASLRPYLRPLRVDFGIGPFQHVDPAGRWALCTEALLTKYKDAFLTKIISGEKFKLLQPFLDSNWIMNLKESYVVIDGENIAAVRVSGELCSTNIQRDYDMAYRKNSGSLPTPSSVLHFKQRQSLIDYHCLFINQTG
jgi:hypothetical protein